MPKKYRHHRFHLISQANLKSEPEYIIIINHEEIAENLKLNNCFMELPDEKLDEIRRNGKNFIVILLCIQDFLKDGHQKLKDELLEWGCQVREPSLSILTKKGESFEVAATRTARAYLEKFS